jgi:hypothetical protein
MMCRSENTEQQSDDIYYILFFSAGAQLCCAILPATTKLCNYPEPKPIS